MTKFATLAVILIAVACAFAGDLKQPIPASVPLQDGSILRGKITGFDEESLTLDGKTIQWSDIKPQALYTLSERLLGTTGTAQQWFAVGKNLRKSTGGDALAERAFTRAIRLDPKIKDEITKFKKQPPSDSPTGATGATTAPDHGGWGTQTPEEEKASVLELRAKADEMLAKAKLQLRPFETRYFLFYSTLQPSEAEKWVSVLDRMYARLATIFAVPEGKNLWRGKAVIFVFSDDDQFKKFEKDVFDIDRPAGGRCHYAGNGDVFITFFRSTDDQRFAQVLVHETTHGFVFRYRSSEPIPNFLNEGLAEAMELELAGHAGLKQADDASARAALQRADPLHEFFTATNIADYQYPIARTLTEFMIRQNKQGYVDFFNGIKDGMAWEDALEKKYGVKLDQLLSAYGQSMGVRDLRP